MNVRTAVTIVLRIVVRIVVGVSLVTACTTGGDPSGRGPGTTAHATTATATATATSTVPLRVPESRVSVDPGSHTVRELRTVSDYEQLATKGLSGQFVLKFSITEFSNDPEIEWLDSSFYTLHDEWYWFQLLNGHSVRGFDTGPIEVDAAPFELVSDVYAWAEDRRGALPLDLRFTTLDRLYSPKFYDIALDSQNDRTIGVGALIRAPAGESGADRWLIVLELSDEVTEAQIDTYIAVVGASVPDAVAEHLAWVPRSRPQELVADEIENGSGPSRDRIVRYEDLAEPGDVEVYSPAISAGRLLVVTDGGRWTLGDAGPDDIVAIDRAPDDLPPGNGLITGTPQTPLAHVNVLALNRGIPNAYLAGLADDATIAQLGRVRSKVLVRTTADGQLDIVPLTDAEYDGWRATLSRTEISVDAVDVETLDPTMTVAELVDSEPSASDLDDLRSMIGGKAAGFVELALPGTTTMPDDAMVITVGPYIEHMERFAPVVEALLDDDDLDSPRLRFLVLEGRGDYDERYPTERDATAADEFAADHPAGTPLGEVLEADGFVKLIRASEIDAGPLAEITTLVGSNFAELSPTQGLRFRSSSTVEDVEGFNGAGLYDSNTGYLDPTMLPDEDDHHRTIERAILRTWSSYWSAVAFEERERENVDHRSGSMAVLVHPRFDDELEVDNGVATLTVEPDPSTAYAMEVNVQDGATSVTNADDESGLLPEVVRVVLDQAGGVPRIERLTTSSIVGPDAVLDDTALLALFDQLRTVSDSWLARANADLREEQRSSTLTLDFEFREMAPGWPALADGSVSPQRMIVKQARTLDPGLRGMRFELLALPIPRDVLAHAIAAVEFSCAASGSVGVRILTDPLARIDLGYSQAPFELWGPGTSLKDLRSDVESTTAAPDGLDEPACTQREVVLSPTQYLLGVLATR